MGIQQWRMMALAALVSLGTGCQEEAQNKAGPNGSWWVGGDDGGVFVLVKEDGNPHDDIFTGAIYFEHDQSPWYQGRLRLVGKPSLDINDQSQYLGWDGERLLLDGGATLEAVDPASPQ